MADKVLFYRLELLDYQNIQDKDPNSVYWITDKGQIYLGDRLQAEEGPVRSINGKIGNVIPEISDINNLQLTLNNIQYDAQNLSDFLSLQTGNINFQLSTINTAISGHNIDISALQSQQGTNTNDLSDIKKKIPAQASEDNQLADKLFVNSSINSLSANYVTSNALGNPFATKAALTTASVYYNGNSVYTPTDSDYCLVLSDESAPSPFTGGQVRYVMAGSSWVYQYGVNEKPFTANQNAAINSGITSDLVAQIGNKLDKNFEVSDAGKILEVQSNGTVGLASSDTIEKNTNKSSTIFDDASEEKYPSTKAVYDAFGETFDETNTIQGYINRLYPIGTIYTTINSGFDPNGIFPGVWTKTGEGRVLVGDGTFTDVASAQRTFTLNETQTGEYNHLLTTNEMPNHSHFIGSNSATSPTTQALNVSTSNQSLSVNSVNTASTGGSAPHNNMQPYMVVIFWKRDS
jgi:hypothetical protein